MFFEVCCYDEAEIAVVGMQSLSNGIVKYASLQSTTKNNVSLARLASDASMLG